MNAAPSVLDDIRPSMPLEWFADLGKVKETPALIDGLVSEGSLVLIYGEANCGKTFLALDMALAIATGKAWRGRAVKCGLVIYVAAESASSVRVRVAAFQHQNRLDPSSVSFAVIPRAVNFLHPQSVPDLISTIRAAELQCGKSVVLVVFDTLSRCLIGGDENSSMDVGEAVAACDILRAEIGATVAIVHHAGKDPSRGARGSSALRAAVDTELFVAGTGDIHQVKVSKQRDYESVPTMAFKLDRVLLVDSEGKNSISSCVVRHLGDAISAPASTQACRGAKQKMLLAELRIRSEVDANHIWSLTELREVARATGVGKATARSVVEAVTKSPNMTPSGDGYLFRDLRVERVEVG